MSAQKSRYALPLQQKQPNQWSLLGSELSPFTLKIINYLTFTGVPVRIFFEQGKLLENAALNLKKTLLTAGIKKLTWPIMNNQDEYPLVPFLFGPDGEALYDSSAIAHWFEYQQDQVPLTRSAFPCDKPELSFLHNLIDEYFDDFGLYMVHHNRWKVSARENCAGQRLAYEMRTLLGPFQKKLDRAFSARQTRRLPYLFSVAESSFRVEGLTDERQPPSHLDFPATHELLETSFSNILCALEPIYSNRPYLFGDCYSLADASIYGQLAMNLIDPEAARTIAQQAPNTFAWLERMAALNFDTAKPTRAQWFDDLQPLLDEIGRTYLPLMQQNEQAYDDYTRAGQTRFNEAAFWKNEAIFAGELDGTPYKSVVKTFQVRTWRTLKQQFSTLTTEQQSWIENTLKNTEVLK